MPGAPLHPSTVDNGLVTEAQSPEPRPAAPAEPPVLPDVSRDEQETGWGDRDDDAASDEWYRRERPPHHE